MLKEGLFFLLAALASLALSVVGKAFVVEETLRFFIGHGGGLAFALFGFIGLGMMTNLIGERSTEQ